MKQKTNRSNKRNRGSRENANINMRNVNNNREVSRRSKGKNRYSYEEDRSNSSKYYEEDHYKEDVRKMKKSSGPKRKEEDYGKHKRKRRGRRKNLVSKTIGYLLAIVQFVLSVVLMVNVLFFNMLPMTYVGVAIGILVILLGITLLSQILAKGKGMAGKIFCIIMCIVLAAGSFYLGKVNAAAGKIFGSNTSTSAIVVAVKAEDKAEKIEDAAHYKFGIQYSAYGDQMRTGLSMVENEVGETLDVQEYNNLIDEANALLDGEVQAIIYNSSQTSIIQEQIPDFEKTIKIIYTHNIVVEVQNEVVDSDMTEPFTVYLSGMDTYNEISSADRSDVNIIAVVNPQSHQILLVTTPRDYYVTIPNISGRQRDKLTHAGIYGIDASMATLEQLYDTDIQFFGRVNFTSLINIVDALGGLEVISDEEFDTGWESGAEIHVNEGSNYLDGTSALAFCRERHALADGDNARGRHQQAVITAMIKKMMSPAMLRGATEIIDSVSDGVDTNFSMEQIQSLIKTQLRKNPEWHIYSVAAEGYGNKQTCYSSGNTPLYVTIPNEQSVANIKDLINRVEAGEVLEGSTNTSE